MPKHKKVPEDFDILDAWEELFILLEAIEKDFKKAVLKGNKRSGIATRKALKYAKNLIVDISNASLVEERKIRDKKPIHGNSNGPGIKAMHKARNID